MNKEQVKKRLELEDKCLQKRIDQGYGRRWGAKKTNIYLLGIHDVLEEIGYAHDTPPAGSKFPQAYKLLCEELQSLRREFFEAKKIELTTGDKTRCNELEAQIKEVDKIVKFIDEQQGRWTDPQTGNYQPKQRPKKISIGLWCTDSPEVIPENKKEYFFQIEKNDVYKPKEPLVRIHGQEIELKEVETEIDISFTSWFMVCSYHQPHTKDRNYKNILVKQDQFPTLQQVQQELENVLGFEVEDVVLMNWKEVNNSYKIQ